MNSCLEGWYIPCLAKTVPCAKTLAMTRRAWEQHLSKPVVAFLQKQPSGLLSVCDLKNLAEGCFYKRNFPNRTNPSSCGVSTGCSCEVICPNLCERAYKFLGHQSCLQGNLPSGLQGVERKHFSHKEPLQIKIGCCSGQPPWWPRGPHAHHALENLRRVKTPELAPPRRPAWFQRRLKRNTCHAWRVH